ncbi:MAG: rod shape-determining protein [Clostridiaceae bacterium]|jgi:rod shape-determining protein MreB|nr:rod shape-determining protein [Clostridiaceae bacterium]
MAKIEIAVDFGSAYITIFLKNGGLALREPTLAAVVRNKGKVEIIESGTRAKALLSRSLGGAHLVYPVKEGMAADMDVAAALIKLYIARVLPDVFRTKISALVLVSAGLTAEERKDIERVFVRAGIKDVMLTESPLALIAYTDSIGGIFVDIGAGTAEIAAVTKRGIAYASTVNIAGNAFNNALIDMAAEKYHLKIGDYSAEKIKISSASLFQNDFSETEAGGRDLISGSPKSVQIAAVDIRNALKPLADYLVEVINTVFKSTPPELAEEIYRKGVFFSGGSSRLPGLKEYVASRLDMNVTCLEDVDNAVALGGGRLLSDKTFLGNLLGIKLT